MGDKFIMAICDSLLQYQDIKYRDFQAKLIPNISKETIIGVRTPDMRKVAKQFFGSKGRGIFEGASAQIL